MKIWRRIDWKIRVIISVFCGVVLVMALFFGVTYQYFRNKLVTSNEKIANMLFQEAERNLKDMMANAERGLNLFANKDLVWEFSDGNYAGNLERDIASKNIVIKFDELLVMDTNVYGFAIMSGDGRTIVSTAKPNSGTGNTKASEALKSMMAKCKKDYPYINWTYSEDLGISPNDPLYLMTKSPMLLGMKALGAAENDKYDSYLIITIEEEEIQKSYEQLAYNESQVVLINQGNQIISSTDKELLGKPFVPEETNQNLYYDLSYDGWKLINAIAQETYTLESRDIRNFGLMVGAAALLGVLVIFVVWSRKYTRPIQNLMEQMERVGAEQFDIARPERGGWAELDDLNEEFYATVQKLKSYISKLQEVEKEKAREELLALQYQINPHFLYNSLNSIRWMALMTNNSRVADSLMILSKIIMPILRDPSFTWKLKDELEFIENYIDMMRIRYGGYMEYHLDCPKELYEEMFPRFILQLVIENCFVHGSTDMEERAIRLTISKDKGFSIEVQNSGTSMDPKNLKSINEALEKGENIGKSIGLYNVRKRLQLLYQEKSRIWLESHGENGVVVHICF